MQEGDFVSNKKDGSIWSVEWSTFGFSLHRKNKDGSLSKTLGMSKEEILKDFELVKVD